MLAMNGYDFYERVWRPGTLVVGNMARDGVQVDTDAARAGAKRCEARLGYFENWLNGWARKEVNWRSPAQVTSVLYDDKSMPLPPIKGTLRGVNGCKPADRPTGEASLVWLQRKGLPPADNAAISVLLQHKKVTRERSFHESLVDFTLPSGRLHSIIGVTTKSGRLASKKPNLLNIPKEARGAFVAKPGHDLVVYDYSGLEWRILAHILAALYNDWSLVREIEQGIDPHNATAVDMFDFDEGLKYISGDDFKALGGEYKKARDVAKILNYSINYGKTAAGLSLQLTMVLRRPVSVDEAQGFIDSFYASKPGVLRWHRDIVKSAWAKGYVRTWLGRWRPMPKLSEDMPEYMQSSGEREAMNTPIQGSAADIVTLAMLRTNTDPELVPLGWYNHDLNMLRCKLVLQVHDELVFEVPKENTERAMPIIVNEMENCTDGVKPFHCPLAVDGKAARTWKEAK